MRNLNAAVAVALALSATPSLAETFGQTAGMKSLCMSLGSEVVCDGVMSKLDLSQFTKRLPGHVISVNTQHVRVKASNLLITAATLTLHKEVEQKQVGLYAVPINYLQAQHVAAYAEAGPNDGIQERAVGEALAAQLNKITASLKK